jgi:hypothetical protein
MDAHQIVVCEMQGYRRLQVFKLLAESVGEATLIFGIKKGKV